MILGQSAFEGVDGVHAAGICLGQFLLHFHIAGDLGEARHLGQAHRGAERVVIGDAVVAVALDVAGHEVLAAEAAVAEEQVADVIDCIEVVRLGNTVGVALEDRPDVGGRVAGKGVDHARGIEDVGIEKVLRERERRSIGIDVGDVGAGIGGALDVGG